MKLCIATVCSADDFQYYIPTFIYTCKRAYPDYFVKIFVKGKLSEKCWEILKELKTMCDPNWKIYENFAVDYPNRVSICNTLRHLLPPNRFKEYTHLYITDVDFLIFKHNKSLGKYFAGKIKSVKQPYASVRGPTKRPSRKHINKYGWIGKYTRIADGMLMLKIPEWWNATKKARTYYSKIVKAGTHDEHDKHPAANYREYNEVMLFRICRLSGLRTPDRKKIFLDGTRIRLVYRDVHMGDFKFAHRNNKYGWIKPENFVNFEKLDRDKKWLKLLDMIGDYGYVSKMIKKIRRYTRKYHDEAMRRYKGTKRRKVHRKVPKKPKETK